MSPSSKRKTENSGQYTELGDRITKVAVMAIREAVKSSKAAKSTTVKTSKPKSSNPSGQ